MSGSTKQTNFGSRLGFILASAGSAVGLGAIWKFPYMAGTNGGAVFMLPYIFFTVTVGMALLLAEFAMGRAGRSGPVGSLNNVCGKPWGIFLLAMSLCLKVLRWTDLRKPNVKGVPACCNVSCKFV